MRRSHFRCRLSVAVLIFNAVFSVASAAEKGNAVWQNATVLLDTETYRVNRSQRFVVAELKQPHRVFSTSYINGGESQNLSYLVNHQSMEAKPDNARLSKILGMGRQQYHDTVAQQLALDSKRMALMGTAADMQQLGHHVAQFGELRIDALVTAGVKGNAMRAGETARWQQTPQGNRHIDYQGTINTLVLVNQPLTSGALIKTVMLATEAKSAALAEMSVPSVRSPHLATGTGTDQITVAALSDSNRFVRDSASGHLKLGELIATAVRKATLKALQQQNQLTSTATASVSYALGRFGFERKQLLSRWHSRLTQDDYQRAERNLTPLLSNARVVASAYALAAMLDRIQYRTLDSLATREALRDQAAQIAVAASGRPDRWSYYWQQLHSINDPMELLADALLLGWQEKWREQQPASLRDESQ